jgi:hypothetical protein
LDSVLLDSSSSGDLAGLISVVVILVRASGDVGGLSTIGSGSEAWGRSDSVA